MNIRIATFNIENLFTRPLAMKDGMGQVGQDAINAHAELNRIISKPLYDANDKARLIELDAIYGFSAANTPANALVLFDKIRGKLFSRSNAGVVTVVANGRQEVLSIKIDPSVVDPKDIDMLQDLVTAAVNEALRKSQDLMKDEMAKLTAGMGLPSGLI